MPSSVARNVHRESEAQAQSVFYAPPKDESTSPNIPSDSSSDYEVQFWLAEKEKTARVSRLKNKGNEFLLSLAETPLGSVAHLSMLSKLSQSSANPIWTSE